MTYRFLCKPALQLAWRPRRVPIWGHFARSDVGAGVVHDIERTYRLDYHRLRPDC